MITLRKRKSSDAVEVVVEKNDLFEKVIVISLSDSKVWLEY